LNSHVWGNMTSVDFETFLENYTGKDLLWFFRQWIYGKGYPVIKVITYKSKSQTEGHYKAKIHISQVQNEKWGIFTNLPVEFVFAGLNGEKVSRVFRMNSRDEVFYIDSLPDFYAPLVNRGDSVRTLLKIEGITTRVEKTGDNFKMELYPNPANDFVFVRLKGVNEIMAIEIIDVTGRVISRYSIKDVCHNDMIKLDMRNLSAGAYFITFKTEEEIKTVNFIKN